MTAIHGSREQADRAAEKLKIFAQPQRLMILSLLLRGECSVAEIDASTGIGQPALSQQLAELRRGELVSTRREAKQIYYSLADDNARLCVNSIEAIFGNVSDLVQPDSALPSVRDRSDTPDQQTGAAAFARMVN
ncbi:MAG: metalloregulator ArsR/SmtB family transcription factor [bacterium]|nr:metalloregulator ArsR/SmtB family transcription factor [bacterium]